MKFLCKTNVFYPSLKKASNFISLANKHLLLGGAGGVSAGGACITVSEYKARGQGWDAAGTGLCSCVEGICNGT